MSILKELLPDNVWETVAMVLVLLAVGAFIGSYAEKNRAEKNRSISHAELEACATKLKIDDNNYTAETIVRFNMVDGEMTEPKTPCMDE